MRYFDKRYVEISCNSEWFCECNLKWDKPPKGRPPIQLGYSTWNFLTWRPTSSSNRLGLGGGRRARAHSTVDKRDLFQTNSEIHKTFWDVEGPLKALHSWNYVRLPYIRDLLAADVAPGEKFSTCLKGKKILDAGCGGGVLAEGLAKYGAEVTGIDINKRLIEVARDHSASNSRLADNMPTYIHTSIEEHCNKYPDHYDAVVVSEVLEHINEQELFVQCCARAARPAGRLVFTTPSRTRAAQLYMIYVFEDVLKKFPKGAHDYNKFLKPSELQFMLEMNDCSVQSVRGYIYRPLANCWEWTPRTWFAFAMEAVKAA